MANVSVQVLVFGIVAVLVPLSLLVFSRLVRPRTRGDEIQTSAYESAEEAVGGRVEIMHEYLHYFSIFLAFEIIGIVLIIWATVSRQTQAASGWSIMLLVAFALVFDVLALEVARKKS